MMILDKPIFKIFLADDDDADRALFLDALGELPLKCETTHFTDGIHLMAQLMIKTAILPNLIFLDINMPLMNGFDCLRKIKDNDTLQNIPVIIYTTALDRKNIIMLKALGAATYLQKPNSYNQLKTVLYRCIKPFYAQKGISSYTKKSFYIES